MLIVACYQTIAAACCNRVCILLFVGAIVAPNPLNISPLATLGFFMGVYRSYQIDNSMFEISEIFFNCGV